MTSNYFELFELPLAYVIDLDVLGERYRRWQAQVHPDRYAHASGLERRVAQQQATLVNDAYRTLRDPQLRASYLLSLHGLEVDANATIQDPGFLMAQMEYREELDDVRRSADVTALQRLNGQLKAQVAAIEQGWSAQFAAGSAEALQCAAQNVLKCAFFKRLLAEVAAIEDELIF